MRTKREIKSGSAYLAAALKVSRGEALKHEEALNLLGRNLSLRVSGLWIRVRVLEVSDPSVFPAGFKITPVAGHGEAWFWSRSNALVQPALDRVQGTN